MPELYPDELIRGISSDNSEFITPEGYPTQAAFRFDSYDSTERDDDFCELSINWLDDDGAIDTLLNQINPKKGTLQFQGGYCRFSRAIIDGAMRAYINNGHLNYERRPVEATEINPANPYHGNILMQRGLSKQTITNIQVALASIAGSVIRR